MKTLSLKGRLSGAAVMALTALTLLCGACSRPGNDTSAYAIVPARGWNYSDSIPLLLRLTDSVAAGRLSVAVSHSAAYPYGDLWLQVTTRRPAGAHRHALRVDTVHLLLSDGQGRWRGSGFGDDFQMAVPLPGRRVLTDSTTVDIRQIMRVDTLRGLRRVGLLFAAEPR